MHHARVGILHGGSPVLGQLLKLLTIVSAWEDRIRREMRLRLETYVGGQKIAGEEVHEHLVCLACVAEGAFAVCRWQLIFAWGAWGGGDKEEEGRMGRKEDTTHGKGAQVERLVLTICEDFARVLGVLVDEDGAVAEGVEGCCGQGWTGLNRSMHPSGCVIL
jgi:hypothetical protein